MTNYLKSRDADLILRGWVEKTKVGQAKPPKKLSYTASPRQRMHTVHENCLRVFGEDFVKNYMELRQFRGAKADSNSDHMVAVIHGGDHPFRVKDVPRTTEDFLRHHFTGGSNRQDSINNFYGPEIEDDDIGTPQAPKVWCYKTNSYVRKPNWDMRKACNPERCKIKGLQDRKIPTGDFTNAIEFLVKTHDPCRIPPTDDPDSQAVHLIRRACSESVIIAEALNECMLAVSNIVSGLPEEDWFLPVLIRWKTIRIHLNDHIQGIRATARIQKRTYNCRSAKRFKKLLEDRQLTLPLPTLFSHKDTTSFVPCQDFAFLAMGPGRYKTKQKAKLLSTKIEMQTMDDSVLKDQEEDS